MERENLAGDAKGKGASGCHREAESTDAPERDGLLRSRDEAGVMLVERRGWFIAAALYIVVSKLYQQKPEPVSANAVVS